MFAQRFRVLTILVVMIGLLLTLFVVSSRSTAAPSASAVHTLTISGVSPAADALTAGTTVTIRGTSFTAGARVVFDETPATDVKILNDKTITATVPANIKTTPVDVTVFVGTEGATWHGGTDPKSLGSRSNVHGYKDDKPSGR